MKETTFVKQNKEKWAKFESLSKQKNNDPDEISELFTEITEDLSYARTFYPRRSVRVYLNHIAQGVFSSLYKQQKQPISFAKFIQFWTTTIPLAVYRSRKNMLMALLFFVSAILLGAISQHFDESFAEIVLGSGYVESTEARIEAGDPMGIYGESSESSMVFRITINNIRVSFFAFVLGIFFSFGSYIILLKNGIMVGAFQWWFYSKGLLLTSFMAIWIHGAFEISAIVIAGAAGITLGNGLLFPKSHSRLQSLIFSAKQGFIILMSLVPVFIIAGTLESFVTRHYQTIPAFLNWFIILGSFAIIILYYGVLPFIVAKKFPDKKEVKEEPRYIPERTIKNALVRTSGQIFSDAVYTLIQNAKTFSKFAFAFSIPLSGIVIAFIAYFENFELSYLNDWYYNFQIVFGFHEDFDPYKYLSWSFVLAVTINSVIYIVQNKAEATPLGFLKSSYTSIIWTVLFVGIIMLAFIYLNWFFFMLLILFGGFFIQFVPVLIQVEQLNLFSAIARSFKIIKSGFGQAISNSLSIIAISLIFFFILHNPFQLGLMMLIDGLLADILVGNTVYANFIINLFNISVYIVFITFITQLFFVKGFYFYHSQVEKEEAKALKSSIESIGKRSKTFETNIDFE